MYDAIIHGARCAGPPAVLLPAHRDPVLVKAPVDAGVELRERFSVQEILWETDRLIGIRACQKDGGMVSEKARIMAVAHDLHCGQGSGLAGIMPGAGAAVALSGSVLVHFGWVNPLIMVSKKGKA